MQEGNFHAEYFAIHDFLGHTPIGNGGGSGGGGWHGNLLQMMRRKPKNLPRTTRIGISIFAVNNNEEDEEE